MSKSRNKPREVSLEKSDLLQIVFDNTDLAIALFQTIYDEQQKVKDFQFVQVNKVLQEMYLEKDVLGRTYLETSKHGIEMGLFDAFKDVMETGEPLDKEFFYDKDSYNNWFRMTARRHENLLIVTIEDITERKGEAQKLKEALSFNNQLMETSQDTIVIINLTDFKIRYVNRDMLARAGMTKTRIENMALPEIFPFIHPRDREKLMHFHKEILKSAEDKIHEIEFRVKTKGSKWEWFITRGKIFNRTNEKWVEEYVLLVRNVTEQRNTEQALLMAEKHSILGEVARSFAHELRNPLASIRMASDVLKKKLNLPEKNPVENYFNILNRSTEVLNNLVSHLLNSSNYSPPVLEKVDLAEVVDETVKKAADRIYLAGIKVVQKYNGPYFIRADKEKLQIALLNIVVNASEATTPQEGVIELIIQEHKTDFLLSIKDNGHGLEQEQIEKLFDAFYTNKSTGVGIGLNSVKNILKDHDAKITARSEPNKGTTFEILFQNYGIN